MLFFIFTQIIFLTSFLWLDSNPKVVNTDIPIIYNISVTDGKIFDFTKIKTTVFIHSLGNEPSKTISDLKIEENGKLEFSMPVGRKATVIFSTTDPTLQFSGIKDDDPKFYSWKQGDTIIIKQDDLDIPENFSSIILKDFFIKRGAAFSLCIPEKVKEGIVYLRPTSASLNENINTFIFNDLNSTKGVILGGLDPGEWEIKIVSNDNEVKKFRINLEEGKVFPCP